jgi:hypothetical protein
MHFSSELVSKIYILETHIISSKLDYEKNISNSYVVKLKPYVGKATVTKNGSEPHYSHIRTRKLTIRHSCFQEYTKVFVGTYQPRCSHESLLCLVLSLATYIS